MITFLLIENNVVVNAIISESIEDARNATDLEIVEKNENDKIWIGWSKYPDGSWRSPQPFPSWSWDGNNDEWIPPIPFPNDFNYTWDWNEELQSWERSPLPQPFPSWTLNEDDIWVPPLPYPDDDKEYYWNEDSLSWVEYS